MSSRIKIYLHKSILGGGLVNISELGEGLKKNKTYEILYYGKGPNGSGILNASKNNIEKVIRQINRNKGVYEFHILPKGELDRGSARLIRNLANIK